MVEIVQTNRRDQSNQGENAQQWSNKILASPVFQKMQQKRTTQENTTGKTRMSLTEIDDLAKVVFSDDMLMAFSDMLEECTADVVRMSRLNDWIVWLDEKKREYMADELAREVLSTYRAKINTRLYVMKVNRSQGTGRIRLKKEPTKKVTYSAAHKVLMSIAMEEAEKDDKVLSLDSDQERLQWEMILRWFIFDEDSVLDIRKSVYVYGSTGRGKSFLARCLRKLGERIQKSGLILAEDSHFFSWNYTDLNRLHKECKGEHKADAKPSLLPMKKTYHGNWIFDELCNEARILNVYGDKYRFFETILTERVHGKTPKRALFMGNNNVDAMHRFYNDVSKDADYDFAEDESRFSSRWRGCVGVDNVLVWVGVDRR